MVRIGSQSAVFREHGRRGGNPALITDPIGKATAEGTPDRTDWQKVVNDWNELAKANGLAGIQAMTDERKRKYKIRMASMPEFWAILKRQIPALAEPVKTSHWMTFDFCVASDQNLTKIMEGKYRDRAVPSGSTRPKAARPTFNAIVAEVVTEVEKRPEIDRDNYVRSLRDKYGKAIQDKVRDVLAFRKEMAARNAEAPKPEET
jgi:hypothetical protein